MKTIEILDKKRCTGCGACTNICVQQCIHMEEDSEGFLYPAVDKLACSQCELCTKVCPVINHPADKHRPLQIYAAWAKDDGIRRNSTSGGIFSVIADQIIEQGGAVVGASYDPDYSIRHKLITEEKDIVKLRQSKYAQSITGDIYCQTKRMLDKDVPVLFCGTPCQCAALRSFLDKKYNNLLVCDFICRGVNSPKVYNQYLVELAERYQSPIKTVWFKNKTYSWQNFCTKIIFENGKEYLADRDTDKFMYGYIKKGLNLYMRPSCGQCEFKGTSRPVDLTLGDFWGVKLTGTDCNAEKGVSFVMAHTEKAVSYLDKSNTHLYMESHIIDEALPGNSCIMSPAVAGPLRSNFFELFHSDGFFSAMDQISKIGDNNVP